MGIRMCIRESISRISTRWMEPKAFLRSVNAIYSGRLLAFALSKIELSDNICSMIPLIPLRKLFERRDQENC